MTQLARPSSLPSRPLSARAESSDVELETLVRLPGFAITRSAYERGATLSLDDDAPRGLRAALLRCMQVREQVGGFAGLVVFRAALDPSDFAIHTQLTGHAGQILQQCWDLPRRLELFVRVGRSVQGLHEIDEQVKVLSPQHVLLNAGAAPHVLGPGLVVAGSEPYQAPESVVAHQFDDRSDIYCLGAFLCFLLTGEAPSSCHPGEAPRAHARIEPLGLRRIVRKACAPRAEDRYESVYGLLAEVARYTDAHQVGLSHAHDDRVEKSGPLPLGTFTHLDDQPVAAE